MLWSPIGLALDIIGALLLSAGLYRHSRPLFPGWSRDPAEAVMDRSFGTVGGSFLTGGFTLQVVGVAYPLVAEPSDVLTEAIWAFGFGIVIAYFFYGVAYICWFRVENAYIKRTNPPEWNLGPWIWTPRLTRFYAYRPPDRPN